MMCAFISIRVFFASVMTFALEGKDYRKGWPERVTGKGSRRGLPEVRFLGKCWIGSVCWWGYHDSFWKSQIGQVFINKKGDAVLIPLLGREEFIFGELTNYEIKFNKIKRYYEEIAPKMGWNKYQEVNVKFEKQIVCK